MAGPFSPSRAFMLQETRISDARRTYLTIPNPTDLQDEPSDHVTRGAKNENVKFAHLQYKSLTADKRGLLPIPFQATETGRIMSADAALFVLRSVGFASFLMALGTESRGMTPAIWSMSFKHDPDSRGQAQLAQLDHMTRVADEAILPPRSDKRSPYSHDRF